MEPSRESHAIELSAAPTMQCWARSAILYLMSLSICTSATTNPSRMAVDMTFELGNVQNQSHSQIQNRLKLPYLPMQNKDKAILQRWMKEKKLKENKLETNRAARDDMVELSRGTTQEQIYSVLSSSWMFSIRKFPPPRSLNRPLLMMLVSVVPSERRRCSRK